MSVIEAGATIGRYRVEELIGSGGMAEVWRARHTTLESLHAIKVLTVGAASIRKRLLREGQVQASLRHPNIVAVTDIVELESGIGLVMEYVDGPALDLWMQHERPSRAQALELFRGIVLGVACAHAAGVVHRDLKPANILLAPSLTGPIPKVADFGIVKVLGDEGGTQVGVTMGTAPYMPPEQVRDARSADRRSDIWALGCILYELLTGAVAFHGPDTVSIFNRVTAVDYVPATRLEPDLPPRIDAVLRSIFQADPDQRPQSCVDLLAALYDTPIAAPQPLAGPDGQSANRVPTPPRPAPAPIAGPGPPPSGAPTLPRSFPAVAPVPTIPAEATFVPPAAEPSPKRARVSWGVVAVLLLAAAPLVAGVVATLGVVSGVTVWLGGASAEPERDPGGPTVVAPAPVLPPPALPPPAPAAVPVPAPVTDPDQAPSPKPSAPAVRPEEPRPAPAAPVAARPAPAPAPAPAPEGCRVAVVGDAERVWLVGAAGRLPVPGAVPPGDYSVDASWPGSEHKDVARISLRPGESARLDCSSFLFSCRVER